MVSVGQESGMASPGTSFSGCLHVVAKLSAWAVISPAGLTGGRSAKLTHMVIGRIQFLVGFGN